MPCTRTHGVPRIAREFGNKTPWVRWQGKTGMVAARTTGQDLPMTQSALDAPLIDRTRRYQDELTDIRRDIHAHPELGLEEYRTSDLVARKLEEWGIEVHRGVGKTGVVGVLRNGNGQDAVGLRADMDALPILEATGLPHASLTPGLMHACGHDGHTTMLL